MTRVVVTGATGFFGRRVCTHLRAMGYSVAGLGRNVERGVELAAQGIDFTRVDITDAPALQDAVGDADAVVHCAALCSPWGSWAEHKRVNVLGTQRVIEACQRRRVRRFVHVSSPSVYFRLRDQWAMNEDARLPWGSVNHYIRSKRAAERLVRAVPAGYLQTIILRPKAIFGPGDTTLMPRLVAAVQRLRMLPVFAPGALWIDLTFVDNAAHAVAQALQAPSAATGRAYNITDGEPVNLITVLQHVLEHLGITAPVCRLPRRPAYWSAWCLELIYRLLRRPVEPPLTRYAVGTLGYSQTLSIAAARQWLDYAPIVTHTRALAMTLAAWPHTPS